MDLPTVIGHRGAAALAPENTLAGIRAAAAIGVTWVEFDVKLSADGRCIVFHDDTLERTTDGVGAVSHMAYDDLARLDAGSRFSDAFAGERIPLLEDALALVLELGMHAIVEIKPSPGRDAETATAAMAVIADRWPAARPPPLVTSFKTESLEAVRAAAPAWPLGLNFLRPPRDWKAIVEALDCRIAAILHRHLSRRKVAEFIAAGVTPMAFTVNKVPRARRLLDWGVASIVTDTPDTLLAGL